MTNPSSLLRPSGAFIGASWASLAIGVVSYLAGLWNGPMALNEKGFYFAVLVLGLFAAVSLQKTVRDKMEGIPVTGIYMGVCWVGMATSLLLLAVGLFNASFELSIKGFYAMAYLLSLFSVVTVQKNVRDLGQFPSDKEPQEVESAHDQDHLRKQSQRLPKDRFVGPFLLAEWSN